MRRLLRGACAVIAVWLIVMAGAAYADYGADCSDFETAQDAQDYYESQGGLTGGDPDALDRDHDGNACDWGPPSHKTPSSADVATADPDTLRRWALLAYPDALVGLDRRRHRRTLECRHHAHAPRLTRRLLVVDALDARKCSGGVDSEVTH